MEGAPAIEEEEPAEDEAPAMEEEKPPEAAEDGHRAKQVCGREHLAKLSRIFLKKTKLCTRHQRGWCRHADSCEFAHGSAELRQATPDDLRVLSMAREIFQRTQHRQTS